MSGRLPPELRDIHAYVDDELPVEGRRGVEQRIAADPDARARLEDYRAFKDAIQALYGSVADDPVPERLQRSARRWVTVRPRAIAASVLLLIAGGWGGWLLHGVSATSEPAEVHVVRDAAMAYAVYAPDVVHPVEVPAARAQHLVDWLTKRLNAPVKVPSLDAQGFRLIGGRLLAADDGPGALFMYENGGGQRIVVYLCENDLEGASTAFRFAQHEKVSVFYWFEGPFSFAIAGQLDRNDLLSLAEAVYHAYQS